MRRYDLHSFQEMNMPNPDEYTARVIELHGGHDRFFAMMDERLRQFNAI